MDCNLPDGRRTVVAVSVSPLGDLLALVDAFGRVMLLECQTFTVRRMWKGMYAWILLFCVYMYATGQLNYIFA